MKVKFAKCDCNSLVLKALESIYLDRNHITAIAPSKFLEFIGLLGLFKNVYLIGKRTQ